MLTTEQAQQIEEALVLICKAHPEVNGGFLVNMALDNIRAARAQEQAEQPVSQEYQDHLVNQSFDWAAMAAKHQFMEGYRIGLAEMREKCAKVCDFENHQLVGMGMENEAWAAKNCAAAIRAIKFEGDTGFRPVSEMVAEHKQDPKKAAAIEKAKMRKAEQEPVAQQDSDDRRLLREIFMLCEATEELESTNDFMRGRIFEAKCIRRGIGTWYQDTFCGRSYMGEPVLNAAPVRTKDLTVSELDAIIEKHYDDEMDLKAMILDGIAADRELNK